MLLAYRHSGKRCLDLILAFLALVLFCPVMAFVAGAIRIRLGSPTLFRQQRPGLRGQPFILVKFRTMRDLRDTEGRMLPDAERMTPLGKILRSFSLDELPELWNVIRGEMSLVGPRPLLMQYIPRYTPEQMRRHDVRPGITGWAQLNGRNALGWEQRFEHDVWYVDHLSLGLDLRILAATVWRTLRREGVNEPGQATAKEFMGRSS